MAAVYPDAYYPGTSSTNAPVQEQVHDDGADDFITPIMSRAESVASDGHSVVSNMTANTPSYLSNVRPPPEYISPASASQTATDSQYSSRGSMSEDGDDDASFSRYGRIAVAEGAVALVNSFLDKLLYDFLATARSTSLLVLKPAVADVLRKSLARDAIVRAEADLEDLLALQDSDNDDDDERLRTPKESGKLNLEFLWKRARLRVMMRCEKSEFDIDDDERHVQEQGLLQGRRFSQTNVISLSSEIFLAGVLDFIAEQLLAQGSTAAAVRNRRNGINTKADPGFQSIAHIIVQESDIEKAALNSSVERLWRNWRKTLRARGLSIGRRSSRGTISGSPTFVRRGSAADTLTEEAVQPNIPDMNYPEHVLASNIPLPMTVKDVDEIEVPWLAKDPDEPVPQRRNTNSRSSHRAVNSVGNFSYFRPMPAARESDSRPSTSPAPTPFIDAPGAWPKETPAEEITEPKYGLGNVSTRRNEGNAKTPLKGSYSPDTPMTQMHGSPIPILDPSQLDSHTLNTAPAPSISPGSIKPVESEASQDQITGSAMGAVTGAGLTGSAVAAGLAVEHESGHMTGEEQGDQNDAGLDEDFKRKSIGDMRSLISGNIVQRPHHSDSSDSYSESVDEDQSATVEEGMGDANQQHFERAGRESAMNTTYPRSVVNGSPSLLASARTMSPRVPPRLPLGIGNSPKQGRTGAIPDLTSPAVFLAGRNLSPSSSSSSSRVEGQRPSGNQDDPLATTSETPRVTDAPRSISKEAPRALQGLGISRQSSDEFKTVKGRSPLLQHRISFDRFKTSRSSNGSGSGHSASSSRTSSLRSVATEKTVTMDERSKPNASLTKLTSASITSPADFDSLMRSNDTIKYTLTPESARDLPTSAFNPQVKISGHRQKNGSKESVGKKGTSLPPVDTDVVGPRPSRAATLSSTTSSLPKDKQPKPRRKSSVSRPSAKNVKPTAADLLAREPTVQTQSTRDFADFIRTTGPDKEQDPFIPLLASKSVQSLRAAASNSQSQSASPTTDRARSLSSASLKKMNVQAENIPPLPAMPTAAGTAARSDKDKPVKSSVRPNAHLTARGAAGDSNSSELIDFIRNGPPERGRIPRTVAPFRDTMDSQELGALSNNIEANKQPDHDFTSANASNNAGSSAHPNRPNTSTSTSSQTPSGRSSINSNARLLPNDQIPKSPATQPAYDVQPARLSVPSNGVPAGMMERKRHRNKDPYYIDDSEDDDLLTALPQDRRPEESLMDFLRNSEPPTNNAPKPLTAAGQAQARQLLNKARLNSVNSLRAASATSQSGDPSALNGKAPATSAMSPEFPNSPQTPAGGFSHDAQSLAPSTRSMTSNTTTRPAHITAQVSSPGSVPRNPNRPRMEVRGAGDSRQTARLAAQQTDTDDLADFLRSSGPPEPIRKPITTDSAPAPVVGTKGQKIEKKKGVKFWKRKTYLDMP